MRNTRAFALILLFTMSFSFALVAQGEDADLSGLTNLFPSLFNQPKTLQTCKADPHQKPVTVEDLERAFVDSKTPLDPAYRELRSEDAAANYVSCYIAAKNATYFKESVEPEIIRAGIVFGDDRLFDDKGHVTRGSSGVQTFYSSFLTCLLFKESKMNLGAVSPVGAVGLGQLMPGTAKDINGQLAILGDEAKFNKRRASELQARATIAKYEALEKTQTLTSSEMKMYDQAREDLSYVGTYMTYVERANHWRRFFDDSPNSTFFNYTGPKGVDLRHSKKGHFTMDTKMSVATSAYYAHTLVEKFLNMIHTRTNWRPLNMEEMHYLFMLVAGSYNRGPALAIHYLAQEVANPRISVAQILANAVWDVENDKSTTNETRQEIDGVSHCMRPKDYTPMAGDKQKTCPSSER